MSWRTDCSVGDGAAIAAPATPRSGPAGVASRACCHSQRNDNSGAGDLLRREQRPVGQLLRPSPGRPARCVEAAEPALRQRRSAARCAAPRPSLPRPPEGALRELPLVRRQGRPAARARPIRPTSAPARGCSSAAPAPAGRARRRQQRRRRADLVARKREPRGIDLGRRRERVVAARRGAGDRLGVGGGRLASSGRSRHRGCRDRCRWRPASARSPMLARQVAAAPQQRLGDVAVRRPSVRGCRARRWPRRSAPGRRSARPWLTPRCRSCPRHRSDSRHAVGLAAPHQRLRLDIGGAALAARCGSPPPFRRRRGDVAGPERRRAAAEMVERRGAVGRGCGTRRYARDRLRPQRGSKASGGSLISRSMWITVPSSPAHSRW